MTHATSEPRSVVTIPAPAECERASCRGDPTEPFVITGTAGRDGIAVYCRRHAITLAADSNNHTRLENAAVKDAPSTQS